MSSQVHLIPILLDGGVITKPSFAEFVEKIFKYLLYDRNQIPYPFERIHDMHKKDFISSSLTTSRSISAIHLKKWQNIQKIIDFVEKIEALIKCLNRLMIEEKLDIKSIAIAFGANLLVFKEIYLIEMPNDYDWKFKHSNKCLMISSRECLTKFFHSILSSSIDDILKKRPEMKITRVSFLLVANEPDHEMINSIRNNIKKRMNILNNYTIPTKAKVYKICPLFSKCSCFESNLKKDFIIFQDYSYTENETTSNLKVESTEDESKNLKWIQVGDTLTCIDYYLNQFNQIKTKNINITNET